MSIDREIQDLRNQVDKDPGNSDLRIRLYTTRARVEGRQVFLEILRDRQSWNQSCEKLQDLAIEQAECATSDLFAWLRTEVYECGGQKHRIATFRSKALNSEFNLVPGCTEVNCHVSPLIVGRFPVTQREWDLFNGVDSRAKAYPFFPIDNIDYNYLSAWFDHLPSGFRLLTMEEWEYCTRGGSSFEHFYWGTGKNQNHCWSDDSEREIPHDTRKHNNFYNSFGLIDLLGNVIEICFKSKKQLIYKTEYLRGKGGAWYKEFLDCNIKKSFPVIDQEVFDYIPPGYGLRLCVPII